MNISFDDEGKCNRSINVAVDIGSTTICATCLDACNGDKICNISFPNPQIKYGADVITRIKRCIDEPAIQGTMRKELMEELCRRLSFILSDDVYNINEICFSGNTVMLHILRGLSVSGLGAAPFTPVTLDYYECESSYVFDTALYDINFSINAHKRIKEHYLPGISAFIGADILSGAIYLDMGRNEGYDLLIDLGTNGELLLLNKYQGYAASTACGPVFDHGVTGAKYGSDSIHAIAGCIKAHLIDKTGLIKEPFFEKGIELDKGFVITQDQVRRFQMAKAAVYAGVKCLMSKAKAGFDEIDNVYISGGLGFYIDVRDSYITKMLPEEIKDKITVSGNTSLEGAEQFLNFKGDKASVLKNYDMIRKRTEAFELAAFDGFSDIYIDSMNF